MAARARGSLQAAQCTLNERNRCRARPAASVAGVNERLDAVAPGPLFGCNSQDQEARFVVHRQLSVLRPRLVAKGGSYVSA
jgi:hypothetical protein